MNANSRDDEAFLKRLRAIVEANLSNEQFGVSELARELRMSRSHIYRRLKVITGHSISRFIRTARLEKALQILRENDVTASEVAYKVGFKSPAYFNHCFHEHFGFPPGEVKNKEFPEEKEELNGLDVTKSTSEFQQREIVASRLSNALIRNRFFQISVILFVLIIITGILFYTINIFSEKNKELSIIVLPFKNLSNDQSNQYFADGITEDIMNNLYWITSMRVVSRTSAEKIGRSNLSASEIATLVNANYVLEGSVRQFSKKTRISVQLIDASNDDHLWSSYFDVEMNDIIRVQDEIALQVAIKLKTVLSENEVKQIEKKPTQNPKAYDYYLQARFLHHKADSPQRSGFDEVGVTKCIQYYEKAIAEDENFAQAYAGLAKAWFSLTAWGFLNSNEGFLNARKLSLKALEIDPDCAQAHEVLGDFLIWGQRKFEEGGEELKTSIRLNPNFATARQGYAQLLMITGPIEEAREQINRALLLEPYFWVILNLNSWIYYFEEEYKKALEACTVAYDYNPNFSSNHWLFVLNYAKLGYGEEMKTQLQTIAHKYSKSDEYKDAIQLAFDNLGIDGLFYWMIETNKDNPIKVEGLNGHPFFIAWWYTMLRDKEEALFWLDKVLEQKWIPYHYFNLIATNPDFDLLRNDPRFLKIVDEIGLTPYHKRKAK